jgi:hypothetical protein
MDLDSSFSVPIPFAALRKAIKSYVQGFTQFAWREDPAAEEVEVQIRVPDLGKVGVLTVAWDGQGWTTLSIDEPPAPDAREPTPDEQAAIQDISDPGQRNQTLLALYAQIQKERAKLIRLCKERRGLEMVLLFEALGHDAIVGEEWRACQLALSCRQDLEGLLAQADYDTLLKWNDLLENGWSLAEEDLHGLGVDDELNAQLKGAEPRLLAQYAKGQLTRVLTAQGFNPPVTWEGCLAKRKTGHTKAAQGKQVTTPTSADLDPAGGRYGTCRDLTIDDVRVIVKRCRDFQSRQGKVPEFHRRQNFTPGGPRSYELETLRSWLSNPRFQPRGTED